MSSRSADYLAGLVRELLKLPSETSWVEFKHNNTNPQQIGEYISALANAAARVEKAHAYLLWGINSKNSADASRFLKEAVEASAIFIQDPSVGTKSRSYLPFWARVTT